LKQETVIVCEVHGAPLVKAAVSRYDEIVWKRLRPLPSVLYSTKIKKQPDKQTPPSFSAALPADVCSLSFGRHPNVHDGMGYIIFLTFCGTVIIHHQPTIHLLANTGSI
jgi:hypothetical protein